MSMIIGDHPDIAAALRTGYPTGTALEAEDTHEARLEFVMSDADDFAKFVISSYGDLVDEYIESHWRAYKDWL